MSHYKHPSMPDATRKDKIYWRRRQARLNPEDTGIIASVKRFYLNTINAIKATLPWFDQT